MDHEDEQLFAALAKAAQHRMKGFKPQELANTAWAYATMDHKDEQLFAALAEAAQHRMRGFKPQELANVAWAFA